MIFKKDSIFFNFKMESFIFMNSHRTYKSTFVWLTVFGIAMGILEAIVVVYIRQIYYPSGFGFPIKFYDIRFFKVETIREISTVVMLISIGVLAGKNAFQKFCYFLFSFAIWDIFYYAGLKLILNWPPSLLTWDVLFLIPVTWAGPVLAPVISSIVFIIFSVLIIKRMENESISKLGLINWMSFISGTLIVFVIYIWDYAKIIIGGGYISDLGSLASNTKFISEITGYIPDYFNWYVFALGEILMLLPVVVVIRKKKLIL